MMNLTLTEVLQKLGHDYEEVNRQEATCVQDGVIVKRVLFAS